MQRETPPLRGHFFDGRTAKKTPVAIRLTPQGLALLFPGGEPAIWPYEGLRLEGSRASGSWRLERRVEKDGPSRLETILIQDPGFLGQLRAVAPHQQALLEDRPRRGWKRLAWIGFGAAGAMALMWLGWVEGLPYLSEKILEKVPPHWEEELGRKVLAAEFGDALAPLPPDRRHALEAIMQRLLATVPEQPYHFQLHLHPSQRVNAFAFPGGVLVIHQGLLDQTQRAEELAGVLAHEIQHVLLRHATRTVVRRSAVQWLLTLMMGGGESVLDFILSAAGQLEALQFSRAMEEEADRRGMEMVLAAQVDPQGMVDIFRKIKKEEDRLLGRFRVQSGDHEPVDMEKWMGYLSTHPAAGDRIRRLSQRAAQMRAAPVPLLPGFDWSKMHGRTVPGRGVPGPGKK